ncbi:DUF2255 family protein [Kribbella sp. CA-293567]|uniref:DUF2255 family protein n=1 Tax=Kribbella sp. CA-293567 TaxID=3002436 RepID=UPI0022DE4FB4|nr:DUF2255 family protein [Kribbella sp. CA-293567]WBQ07562.1 DUF2255 family protein [Kribbella sp. CA-293567]
MTAIWTPDDIQRISTADELEIAPRLPDGTLRRWLPIWVVCVDEQVYVRTWYRRDTGWFAQVLESHRACIRVPGLQADVTVTDVADESDQLRAAVDAAYQAKYERYGAATVEQMIADEAAATTLQLNRR